MKNIILTVGLLGGAVMAQADEPASAPVSSTSPPIVTPSGPATTTDSLPRIEGPLSIEQAVDLALKNSPVIRGAQAEIDMAQAQVTAARAGFKPSLSATTFVTGGSESGSIYGTPESVMPQNLFAVPRGPFTNQNLMLMWPLATGGRLKALVRQAQAARATSSADFETVKLDLALEIKTDYRQVLLAQEMAVVARERQKATAERLQNDTAAVETGRVPQLYVLRDEAEYADARQEVTNADRDVEIAVVMLRTGMGVAPDSDFTLSDTQEGIPAQAPGKAVDVALKQRPEVLAAQSRLENARLGLAAAQGSSRPQIALQAMADANRARGGSNLGGGASVGIVVGIPIFDGGLRRAERGASRAGIAMAQADLDKIGLRVEREIAVAQLTLAAAQKNLTTSQSSVEAAAEAYRVAGLRYESGRGTNVEVLDALAAFTRSQGNRARARYDLAAANDQLARALGTP